MCNLYSQTKSQDAMRHVFDDVLEGEVEDLTGNLAAQPGIYPDYPAPILRHGPRGGWQLAIARCVTNIRNAGSPHWRRWLGVEHRCLVPFTSFAEIDGRAQAPRNHLVWFALGEDRPLAFFAGVRTEWTSVRKVKEGAVTAELFAFLTCAPNREVGAVHPRAMPVILTRSDEWRRWLTAPTPEALSLQRPLPDGALEIVLEGAREDAA
jgi:putative SOS response-associated peptidase YedK